MSTCDSVFCHYIRILETESFINNSVFHVSGAWEVQERGAGCGNAILVCGDLVEGGISVGDGERIGPAYSLIRSPCSLKPTCLR